MHMTLNPRYLRALSGLVAVCLMNGCVAQQADLKQTERHLQQKIKQSSEELAQTRARQSQEISTLREQELPQLRGELERALHQAQELQNKQEDLKQRSAILEQQTRKLEQLASKMETESATRYAWVQKSFESQDAKNKEDRDHLRGEVNNRLDEMNRQMELLRKDIIEAVQKTNSLLVKNVDAKLDEQRKSLAENQTRTEQLSARFTQFGQAMGAFKESLTALTERVSQDEQATKSLTAKVDTDIKASTAHVNEATKVMTGHLGEVNKSVAAVAQKLAASMDEQSKELNNYMTSVGQKLETRINEQDHRLDELARAVEQASKEARAVAATSKADNQQGATRSTKHSTISPYSRERNSDLESETVTNSTQVPESASQAVGQARREEKAAEAVVPKTTDHSDGRPDRSEYERLLGLFRDGKLDESRAGFSAFLTDYPNSDLAPNARYWLGESHYGKKEYKQAIDSYDRVELDYPQSDKVPAAILKKGYAYLALKDKKRASSAFNQVVTLYPKSPEAGKAYVKLSQLKEPR